MIKSPQPATFGEQMAESMAELRAIMTAGASPTANGRLTARTIDVAEPSNYDAKAVKKVRDGLNVSQAVFAQLLGVSDVLVRSWERGARSPAPAARRRLDQIREHPGHFSKLVITRCIAGLASVRRTSHDRSPNSWFFCNIGSNMQTANFLSGARLSAAAPGVPATSRMRFYSV